MEAYVEKLSVISKREEIMNIFLETFDNFETRAKKKISLILKVLVIMIVAFQFSNCRSVKTTVLEEQTFEKPKTCTPPKITLLADDDNSKKRNLIKAELERNCRLWFEKNILDYDMALEGWAEASVPQIENALVKVRGGKIQSIEPSRPATGDLMIYVYEQFGTVDKMFDEIKSALEDTTELKVLFNKEFGYPEKLEINYLLANDHSYRVTVKKFEIIK